ncbi:MAG: transglutaminase domain-containing protein [Candidatus Hadarchaeales archaeon]
MSAGRKIPIVFLAMLLVLYPPPIAGEQAEAQTSVIVTPENSVVLWEEGKEIVVSPVQRGGMILRPHVTVEWDDPGLAENISVENLIGPRGEMTIRPVSWDDGVVNPRSVTVEWENVPVLPAPLPAASEVKVIPVENVRPPDLVVLPENFENMSPWQSYVTPWAPAVRDLAWRLKSVEEAYMTAVGWVWVSDRVLHGVEERWLYPQEFLSESPFYPTNPVRGSEASDCESQAYTLVSVLRAMGMPPENVRVAVGKVQFGDQIGGHAWAEIYVYDRWLQLEATSGPYWDDENRRLVDRRGIPCDYFGSCEYPALEVWAYFNDAYYYNTMTGEGNAPEHWHTFSWTPVPGLLRLLVVFAAAVVVGAGITAVGYILVRDRKRKASRECSARCLSIAAAEFYDVFFGQPQSIFELFL